MMRAIKAEYRVVIAAVVTFLLVWLGSSLVRAWAPAIAPLVILAGFAGLAVAGVVYARRYRASVRELREEDIRLSNILRSVGDGLIATDNDGRVMFLNDVARRLTGWDDEAIGRPLAQAFNIIDARTREPVANPVDRVWREQKAITLTADTLLLARDGTEHYIADSATPVRDDSGEINGIVLVFRDVTDQRTARIEKEKHSKRLRAMFDKFGDAFVLHEFRCDEEGVPDEFRFLDINPAFERVIGVSREDILGKTAREIYPEAEPSWVEQFRNVASTGQPAEFDFYSQERAGHYRATVYSPCEGLLAALLRDVTEDKQRRERTDRINAVLDGSAHALHIALTETRPERLPQRLCDSLVERGGCLEAAVAVNHDGRMALYRTGLQDDGAVDRSPIDVEPEWRPSCWEQQASQGNAPWVVDDAEACSECPVAGGGGRNRIRVPLVGNGEPLGVLCVVVPGDVGPVAGEMDAFRRAAQGIATAMVRAGREQDSRRELADLREREAFYRQLIERAHEGIWMIDGDDRTVFVNPRMAEMLGYDPAEMHGVSLFEFAAEQDAAGARECLSRHRQGIGERHERTFTRKDGTELQALVGTSAVFDDAGEYVGAINVVLDISEHAQAVRDVENQEKYFESLVDSASEVIATIDSDANIVTWNKGAENIFGYTAEEAVGRSLMMIVPERSRKLRARLIEKVLAEEGPEIRGQTFEMSGLKNDGTEVPLDVSLGRWKAAGQTCLTLIARDIVARKTSESQVLHAHKMEAIERLAGGIAHDFNNQLAIVRGYCELILTEAVVDKRTLGQVKEIRGASLRAEALVEQLLSFSRKQMLRPQRIDLNGIIARVADPLAKLVGEDISISVHPAPDLGTTQADPFQVEQVLMNLAANARDAMPDGGKLTVETANASLTAAEARRIPGASAGNYVLLSVTDTGTGMDETARSQAFEPFFSMKPVGEGTGLGLATVYGFVKQSGGATDLQSTPGKGTTVRIFLPRLEQAGNPESTAGGLPKGDETILFAEDEQAVRKMVADVLRRCGYSLLTAKDGQEGISLSDAHEGRIDLLLADVVMPNASGAELAEHLRSKHPDLPVVYITGYSEEALLKQGSDENMSLLLKPFSPEELARAVRRAIDESH